MLRCGISGHSWACCRPRALPTIWCCRRAFLHRPWPMHFATGRSCIDVPNDLLSVTLPAFGHEVAGLIAAFTTLARQMMI
eukprot:6756214-Alexandrium_andersonii.AAC.1